MKTLSLLSVITGLVVIFVFGFAPTPQADAWGGKPCSRKKFKTKMVKNACAKGGQRAAKKAMKTFVKAVKKAANGDPKLACDSCHSKLKPDYPLAKNGLDDFKKFDKLLAK